jgi:ubiquinone biosynthesis protein
LSSDNSKKKEQIVTTDLLLFKLFFKPVVSWATRQAFIGRNRAPHESEKGRFTKLEVDGFLDQSWHSFDEVVPDVSREPTFGSRMNVRLAALTLAMLRSLTASGVERKYAVELIGDTCWKVYQYWGRVGRFLGHLTRRHPIRGHASRIGRDGSWPMSFPFNPPGYRARYVPTQGGLGFNVIRCPVAEYFHTKGAADLAVGTWCMLDYPLAEMIDLKLIRTQTLTGNDLQCDFRWFPAARES